MATEIKVGDKVTWQERSMFVGKPDRMIVGIIKKLRERNGIQEALVRPVGEATIEYFVSIKRLTRVTDSQGDANGND